MTVSSDLSDDFRDFIQNPVYPCVGAKSALAKGTLDILIARDLRSNWNDRHIYEGLEKVIEGYRKDGSVFRSFAVVFQGPSTSDERSFEEHLWKRAESLTNKDTWLGVPRDPRVSDDPEDPHFSLSFAGEAFFIVGLHPKASRPARRFKRPALVFNLHDQFERLRAQGRYEKMRDTIIQRDVEMAGSINPMLARHGSISEARQYSGRAVEPDWECPFNPVRRD
jgi:FPC/CPF motif-containing protein YcgG